MTPTKHPLSWFIERIGKTVVNSVRGQELPFNVVSGFHAHQCFYAQSNGHIFRDPHPLSSAMLLCWTLECSYCGKIVAEEGQNEHDREMAAKVFEGDGWKRLEDGTVNCGCGE